MVSVLGVALELNRFLGIAPEDGQDEEGAKYWIILGGRRAAVTAIQRANALFSLFRVVFLIFLLSGTR